jgi:HPt (histidine-containing phosphotransfer) domain-containing protein
MTEVNQDRPIVDVEYLQSITGGDATFEKELLQLFLDSSGDNLERIADALELCDDEAWYKASHAFKGSAASIGAFGLSEILEYAQKHNKDGIKEKTEVLSKIKAEFVKVEAQLKVEIAKRSAE